MLASGNIAGVWRNSLTRIIWSMSDDEVRMGYRKGRGELAQAWGIIRRSGNGIPRPLALSGPDPDHSMGEPRYITFGISSLGRLLAVFHTHRPGVIRIISARRVTRAERKLYEEN